MKISWKLTWNDYISQFLHYKTDLDLEDTEDQRDLNELSGEGNIENMLFVEQGLRELTSLKVFIISLFYKKCAYMSFINLFELYSVNVKLPTIISK